VDFFSIPLTKDNRMLPIIPILAWTGGIAAGAQVVGGFARGAGQLARGRPGEALVEVADGLTSPLRMVLEQVGKLGGDVVVAFMGTVQPEPLSMPVPPLPRTRRRRDRSPKLNRASPNGMAGAVG
jgi:hypothetical protein